MFLVYVDVLAISHELKVLIDAIGEYYKVKPGSDKEPDIYLGANVKKVQMPDGREVWAMSPWNYVKNAIKTVKGLLAKDGEGYVLKNERMLACRNEQSEQVLKQVCVVGRGCSTLS
jgi:hypothetical protein